MKVARIIIEAPVASFRYPHFLIGRQVTFDMPPPSTIYGHLVSAAGEWIEPSNIKFAYNFRFQSKASDLEYQHIVSVPKTKKDTYFEIRGEKHRISTSGPIQPHLRDFLFDCVLTLYLAPPELGEVFKSPIFCVNFGRSQDLAKISMVEEVELLQVENAYLEHTLLPFSFRARTGRGVTILMPRFITPPPEREPFFERYIVLHERVFAGDAAAGLSSLLQSDDGTKWWVDPDSSAIRGMLKGVLFHSFQ